MSRLDVTNARIGARRARLLDRAALHELLVRPTTEARVERLRALPLGAALPAAPSGGDLLGHVEQALRTALALEAVRLVAAAEGARARRLLEAWLALGEAEAVKAVLRGVAAGAAIDRTVAAAPPVPGLPAAALRFAAAAASLEAAVDALGSVGCGLATALREALPGDPEAGLLPLEIAADGAALGRARQACRGSGEDGRVLARHLEDLADARNAATLLVLAGAIPRPAPWVDGGRRWDAARLDRLARAGADGARDAVADGFGVPRAALDTAWSAERALEAAAVRSLRLEARRRPLSIAVPLAYLAARREELRRVSLVLRGAALGVAADELLQLVEA